MCKEPSEGIVIFPQMILHNNLSLSDIAGSSHREMPEDHILKVRAKRRSHLRSDKREGKRVTSANISREKG